MRSAALVTQNHLSKPEDLMLQNATLSGNQHPDLLTSLMNMSLVLRLPREMHLARSSAYVPRLPSFLKLLQNPHVLLTFVFWHNLLCLAGIYMHKQREFPFKRVASSASNVISIYVFEWTQNYNPKKLG